jgi:DNA invertase Pin-like site-specific DNA recombinase
MTIALYARVSSQEQRPEIQLHALREYAERRGEGAVEFVDHGVSGGKDRRPALDELMQAARRREIKAVAVTKLDRLARSVRHLTNLASELEALGVDLVVLDQGIDTSTATGRLLFNVLGAIGEFERDLIVDRTKAGLAAARRRGIRLGRPRALGQDQVKRARRLASTGHSVRKIAKLVGCSPATAHRAVTSAR